MRTGSDYLRSLNDGRQVFIDGERVKDVTAHVAFREAARSLARLYDIAAAPQMRELMTFISPKTGEPVLRAYQIPRRSTGAALVFRDLGRGDIRPDGAHARPRRRFLLWLRRIA